MFGISNRREAMKFKGTSGPWYADRILIDTIEIVKIKSYEKIIGNLAAYEFRDVSIDETNANAQLISKAPEMLEMLNECLNILSDVPLGREMSSWAKQTKQLIKEATEL